MRDLLALLEAPLLTVSLIMPNYLSFDDEVEEEMDVAPQNIDEVEDALEGQVDMIIDAGFCTHSPSSIIDLTGDEPAVIRAGAADVEPFQW